MVRARVLLLVGLSMLLTGCFRTDADSVVGADGVAATRMVLELDLGAMEEIFGGLAESFGESPGEVPGLSEQVEASFDELDEQIERLYADHPELRDRFRLEASFEDQVLRTEIAALTDDVDELAALYESVLGSGDADFEEIFDVPAGALDAPESEVGGGSGIFSDVSATLTDDEFTFTAEPPAGGGLSGGFEIDMELFAGLTPEITVSITAPGDVIDTNGDADGRTVTWQLSGTEGRGLHLRSEVDPSVSVDGLDAVDGVGGDDDDDLVTVVIAVVAVIAAAAGAWALVRWMRAPQDPEAPSSTPGTPGAAMPAGPPAAPGTGADADTTSS